MSNRQHEINNLLTNAKLSQDVLIEYAKHFKQALEGEESEDINEKLKELTDVVENAERSLEKIIRILNS